MPIPASQIVQVNPRLISPGGNDLQFNALFLTTNPVIPTSQLVLRFSSPEDVGAYFGLASTEYELASTYFQGYDDSFMKPFELLFAPLISGDVAAFVRGGEVTDLVSIQSITAGTLDITFGEYTAELTALDFSAVTSLSGAATVVQTALQAFIPTGESVVPDEFATATVEYSSVFNAFTITSGAAGADANVTFPSGSAASAFGLMETNGAVVSPGANVMTAAENMAAIAAVNANWVTFMSTTSLTQQQTIDFAAWAAAQGVNYLFVFWDDSAGNVAISPSGTIAQALTEANAGSVAGIYGDAKYGAFLCSIAACINYNRANGAITFKFKGQAGLPALVTNGTDATTLDSIGMNFIGNYATRNDNFIFLANGEMFGEWKWIDAYLNAVFLNNAIQTACMAGLSQSPRTPFTPAGYNQVRAWIQDPVTRALRAGIIETGVTINELQRAQLMRETGGVDISGYLTNDGYYIMVHEADAVVRQARGPLTVSLWYAYGGAVHRLIVESSAVV